MKDVYYQVLNFLIKILAGKRIVAVNVTIENNGIYIDESRYQTMLHNCNVIKK